MSQNRKNLKRITAMILAVIMAVSVAGCGSADKESAPAQESSSVAVSESAVSTETVSEAEAETETANTWKESTTSHEEEPVNLSAQASTEEKTPTSGNKEVTTEAEKQTGISEPVTTAEVAHEETEPATVSDSSEPESLAETSSDPAASSAEIEEESAEGIETSTAIPVEIAVNETQEQPSDAVNPIANDATSEEDEFEDEPEGLTLTQRNSINMLNYMTVLTQEINDDKGNQLFLESAYSSLVNDIYPNSVDTKTQAQITSLMDTVNNYRMISVKRDRLKYIYEQNRAQALRQAIPNPVGLLSAVQSGSLLKAAASVIYMAVDAKSSYEAAKSQADLQFIKDGWELDDAESAELHNSTKNALNYMLNMVRDYDLPGDYALSAEAVSSFVSWSGKPDSQLVGKIAWFESHKSTYQEYGPYWLEMAKDYYNSGEYEKCLDAIKEYEAVSTRIFRKDIDYATALPMAIVSAKETMDKAEYIKTADQYCSTILANIKDADWSLRYFAAQIYMDLYALTKENSYLDKAYKAAFDNVVVLVEEQKTLNSAYVAEVKEEKADKNASKREKKEIKEYNKLMKEERKIALPPVSEALYLNCDLLFALANKMNIPESKKNQIDSILHENGENIFLTQALDDRFWFGKTASVLNSDEIEVSFDGTKLTVPATCVTDRSIITVTVKSSNGNTVLDDWTVTNVKRPKNSTPSEYIVYFESKKGKDHKYQPGETVSIKVIPVAESQDEFIEFTYNVVGVKVAFVFNGTKFERVYK